MHVKSALSVITSKEQNCSCGRSHLVYFSAPKLEQLYINYLTGV